MATSGMRKQSVYQDDDDDGDWNTSKARPKPNFFDDDDDGGFAKEFVAKSRDNQILAENDNDSLGAIAVTSTEPAEPPKLTTTTDSVRYQPPGGSARVRSGTGSSSFSALPTEAWTEPKPSTQHVRIPPISNPNQGQYRGHSRSPSSISDVVAATARDPTHAEVAKLNAKIKSLQRQLESESVGSLSVEETVKRMLRGKPYLLESYRTLEDKKSLLRCALSKHDGNAINAIILYLEKTLTKSLFQKVLLELGAAEQYVSYLRQADKPLEAEDIVSMIGKSEEAAMVRYRYAIKTKNLDSKVKQLQNCVNSHFELDETLSSDRIHVANQISLLRIQQIIEKSDSELEASGNHPIMKLHRRTGNLLDQSILTTLYYCCLYHYDQPANQFSSPQYIIQNYQLTDAQLQWAATAALARIHRWTQLEQIFAGKKWYGKATMTSVIGFGNVVKILCRPSVKATPDIVDKYCAYIEDQDERLHVAKKYKCYNTAIDTMLAMKDRIQLLQYKKTLPYGSMAVHKATAALESSTKWKN